MYISVHDLGIFILFSLAVIISIYFIITLKNANILFTQVKNMIENNEKSIEKTISALPQLAKNTNDISEILKETMDKTTPILPSIINNVDNISTNINKSVEKVGTKVEAIGEGISDTVNIVKERTEDVDLYLKIISEVMRLITSMLSRS